MKAGIIAAISGCVIVVIAAAIFLIMPPSQTKYEIRLDPFKDPQDLFTTARVTIQNTGNARLTNVLVDYGGYIDKIPLLKPGEKLILSPPQGNKLVQVTVTSDEGIHKTMPYRLPLKMPGMMGS